MSEWISVKDRLPEPWVEVLVYRGEDLPVVSCEVDTNGNWLHFFDITQVLVYRGADKPVVSCEVDTNGNWLHFFNITHWMPLPEPPKEC